MASKAELPSEWVRKRLDAVGSVVTGSTPPTAVRAYYGHDKMFVSPADLGETKYIGSTAKMLSLAGFARSRRIPAGATLFVCIGSTIGKVGLAADELATNQQINAVIPNGQVEEDFLYYAACTLSARVRQRASEQAVPLVNKTDFSAFEIPLPPKPEQRKIAGALNDADSAITTLERLIAKKRDTKQGMAQRLLTARSRLSGFSAPWQTRTLDELLSYEQPTPFLVRTTKQLERGRVPVLTAGKTFVLGYTNENHGIYRAHPVIIFDDFTTASKFVNFDFKAKSSAMKILSARNGISPRFVYERMQLISVPLGEHKRHWISEYRQLKIDVPEAKEQEAIARVLQDAEAEIAVLSQKLTKMCDLRQGMLQVLLSGRIRLPAVEAAA